MDKNFKVKIKTIKTIKENEKENEKEKEELKSVSKIDSLFKDDFIASYFSKKELNNK